jgi:TolA-binding protein
MTTLIDKHSDTKSLIPYAHRARGIARQELGDFQNAIDDLNKFLDSNPPAAEKSHAQYVLGLAQYGLKQYDKAAETFRAILVTDPKYASIDNVLYDLAWALKEGGKDTESTATFERLSKDHPESSHAAEALFHIGEAQYVAKDYKAASKSFYDAMNKAGKSDIGEKSSYQLALAYYQLEQYDKAQQGFEYQLGAYPKGDLAPDAQFMLAESWFKQNKYDVALTNYQKFLAKPSTRNDFLVLAQLHAGQSAAQVGKWDESLKLLDQAQKSGSDSQVALEITYERGWAKQNLGQLEDALKLYTDVADKTDREIGARARFMIGEIQFEKKEYTEAVRNFYKVAFGYGANAPEPFHKWQANSAYEAGRCFEVMRKTQEAKDIYKQVVDRFPNSDKAPLAKKRLAELGN